MKRDSLSSALPRLFPHRIVFLLGFASITCCSRITPELPVLVEIPLLPKHLAGLFSTEGIALSYIASNGRHVTEMLPASCETYAITIDRAPVVPIIARPIISEVESERLVAGAFVFSDEPVTRPVKLKWSDGFLGSFVLEYLDRPNDSWGDVGSDVGSDVWFNVRKLCDRAREVTGGNPWNLDLDALSAGFESYLLSRSVVRKAETHLIPLPLSAVMVYLS